MTNKDTDRRPGRGQRRSSSGHSNPIMPAGEQLVKATGDEAVAELAARQLAERKRLDAERQCERRPAQRGTAASIVGGFRRALKLRGRDTAQPLPPEAWATWAPDPERTAQLRLLWIGSRGTPA